MSDELKTLVNSPIEYPIGERTLQLTPMKLIAALRAQEVVEPFIADLVEGDSTINVTRLSMRYATRMFELCLVMLGAQGDRQFLEGLDEETYEGLLWKLIEVNQDFFARRVRTMALANLPIPPQPAGQ